MSLSNSKNSEGDLRMNFGQLCAT